MNITVSDLESIENKFSHFKANQNLEFGYLVISFLTQSYLQDPYYFTNQERRNLSGPPLWIFGFLLWSLLIWVFSAQSLLLSLTIALAISSVRILIWWAFSFFQSKKENLEKQIELGFCSKFASFFLTGATLFILANFKLFDLQRGGEAFNNMLTTLVPTATHFTTYVIVFTILFAFVLFMTPRRDQENIKFRHVFFFNLMTYITTIFWNTILLAISFGLYGEYALGMPVGLSTVYLIASLTFSITAWSNLIFMPFTFILLGIGTTISMVPPIVKTDFGASLSFFS